MQTYSFIKYPGGMMSNFRNQLKEQGMGDQLLDVMKEIPYVRERLGWIPLVTPTSQIVGTQSMLNVKFGRWKMLSQPVVDILLGKYGKTPGPVDPELRKKAEGQAKEESIDCRPADLLEPRMDILKQELKLAGFPVNDDMAVLHAMFPQELKKHIENKGRPHAQTHPPKNSLHTEPARWSQKTNAICDDSEGQSLRSHCRGTELKS